MQEFSEWSENEYLNTGMPKIYKDIVSAASNFSGNAFPTTCLHVGMICYRTDQKKAYRLVELKNDNPTWKVCDDSRIAPGVAETDKNGNVIDEHYAPISTVPFVTDKDGDIVMKRG